MTNHDRKVLETVAQEVLGWKVFDAPAGLNADGVSFSLDRCPMRVRPNKGLIPWNPLESIAEAWEVLEKIVAATPRMQEAFIRNLRIATKTWCLFPGPETFGRCILGLTPRRITEAAYVAAKEVNHAD